MKVFGKSLAAVAALVIGLTAAIPATAQDGKLKLPEIKYETCLLYTSRCV